MSEALSGNATTRIIALQGAESAAIQRLLAKFAARRKHEGIRVAGAVEVVSEGDGGSCGSLALTNLSDGAIIRISQDLGPGSTSCNIDPAGLAEACAAVERDIARGADLVVLSKFGKQEAARGGLGDAFRASIEAGLPVVTAVSPAMAEPWQSFAGGLSAFIQAEEARLEAWWIEVCDGNSEIARDPGPSSVSRSFP
ncbi:MAG: DUF2478 domain-containing protein [Beijerinckiaceae bacterium]|nr:DUF2478 domain-containing protein [Beijerinckiaceae bacterium]